MIAYLIRRILYAIHILIGVNLLTFALFFVINTPDDMARVQLGRTLSQEDIHAIVQFLHTLTGEYQGRSLTTVPEKD